MAVLMYQRYLADSGIVAWGPVAAPHDHLFVWKGVEPTGTTVTLDALLTQWNQATVASPGVLTRSIYFCQSFDGSGSQAALKQFLENAAAPGTWGKLAYWADATFNGGAPNLFPDGSDGPILVADLALVVSGKRPSFLDDFQVTWDGDSNHLLLKMNSAADFTWSIGGAAGETNGALAIPLQTPSGYAAGAIGLAVECPVNLPASHPIRKTRLLYQAAPHPEDMPGPGGDPVQCRTWYSEVTDKVEAGVTGAGTQAKPRCPIFLDPRDALATPAWLGASRLNSRIEFGSATIHTSLFGATGQRFSLKANDSGTARLGVVSDYLQSDLSLIAGNDVIFHPEGRFQIVGSGSAASSVTALNIGTLDMVAGSATTEFFDVSNATHLNFVQGPAFFLEGETVNPTTRQLFDPAPGKRSCVTAYIQCLNGGSPLAADYHSQPAEASLFEFQSARPDQLLRHRKPYGTMLVPMPMFPGAGYLGGGTGSTDELTRFETTHLAQSRRNKSRTATAPASTALAAVDPTAQLVITPQGLLAQVSGDGSYEVLYLGNPDSQTPRTDFSLRICNSNADIYGNVQQALASNHLFMVFRNPTIQTLNVIAPAATLHVHDFSFSVGPTDLDGSNPCTPVTTAMNSSVFLVKYFTGQSLDDLVKNPTLWACQALLAPAGSDGLAGLSTAVKTLTELGDAVSSTTPDYLKDLETVWFDKTWQGVLALDIPVPGVPDIIAALQPGFSPDLKTLRAHHFGLNAVPVRSGDLGNPTPQRPGSAFGLIRYVLGTQTAPTMPTTVDKEPIDPSNPPPHPATRTYGLVVNSLQIILKNSQISSFQANVSVNFDHLFWDPVSSGGSIVLDGSYESRTLPNGNTQDVFSLLSTNPIVIDFGSGSYLKELTIARAQLSVVSKDSTGNLTVFVGLDGTLVLSENVPQLPLFSVKQIRLSSFGFQYTTGSFNFGFKADGISADIDFSTGALDSLLSMLPVKLKGMSIAIANLIDLEGDLHFQPLSLPGFPAIGTKLHFGFMLDLDLGSIGQLAGGQGSFHVPLLIGWAGGSSPGLALGIQFPSFSAKIDIGIQQFIRLQAQSLTVKPCSTGGRLTAISIQAVDARVVMFGKSWPQNDTAFVIFIPLSSDRKPSWALGVQDGAAWYVGGGYRIDIDTGSAIDTKDVVKKFQNVLNKVGDTDICTQLGWADKDVDDWSIVGQYIGDFTANIAVSDPKIYGIDLTILGYDFDLLYRRVNSQLGIFSIEVTLPTAMRTFQCGAATVRLPVFRLEVHTDGGFLVDFGFPWNNDFSRSAQVEFAIFLGSGGCYYGYTSAAASDLLQFDGGYGLFAPDPLLLNTIRTVRMGFAARFGIGRSFTIGILNAEASITIFGGIEGAAGYQKGADLFSPTLFALKGYVGLMLDISASVNFSIIQASARILAYADVGLQLRKVLVRKTATGIDHYTVTLPVVIYAEIGLTVGISIQIHIGCIDVTIHLSFSTTWRYEETLGSLGTLNAFTPSVALQDFALTDGSTATPFVWSTSYKYWLAARNLIVYATVLPCMANSADTGETGAPKTCVVGTMMLPVLPLTGGFGDLTRFLAGWVLLPSGSVTGDPNDYAAIPVTLGSVTARQTQMKDGAFWGTFPDHLLTVMRAQFAPTLTPLAKGQDDPFAVIPPWPDSKFSYMPIGGSPIAVTPVQVMEEGSPMAADRAAFAEYCRHLLVGTLGEIQLLLENSKDGANAGLAVKDPTRSLNWSKIWDDMFQAL